MGSHSRTVWSSEQFPHTFRTNQDHSWLDVCKSLGGHSDLMKLWLGTWWIPFEALSKPQWLFRRRWATFCVVWILTLFEFENLSSTSQSAFVFLHMRHRLSLFYPVALLELVFCFVSIQVELASLQSPILVHWHEFEISRMSTELSRERK